MYLILDLIYNIKRYSNLVFYRDYYFLGDSYFYIVVNIENYNRNFQFCSDKKFYMDYNRYKNKYDSLESMNKHFIRNNFIKCDPVDILEIDYQWISTNKFIFDEK